jgi:hypothetical protein
VAGILSASASNWISCLNGSLKQRIPLVERKSTGHFPIVDFDKMQRKCVAMCANAKEMISNHGIVPCAYRLYRHIRP